MQTPCDWLFGWIFLALVTMKVAQYIFHTYYKHYCLDNNDVNLPQRDMVSVYSIALFWLGIYSFKNYYSQNCLSTIFLVFLG